MAVATRFSSRNPWPGSSLVKIITTPQGCQGPSAPNPGAFDRRALTFPGCTGDLPGMHPFYTGWVPAIRRPRGVRSTELLAACPGRGARDFLEVRPRGVRQIAGPTRRVVRSPGPERAGPANPGKSPPIPVCGVTHRRDIIILILRSVTGSVTVSTPLSLRD